MKRTIFLSIAIAAVCTAPASAQVVMGAAVNIGKSGMVMGDPVAGISGNTSGLHATHGSMHGIIEVTEINTVGEIVADADFKIYPNPTVDILNIDRNTNAEQSLVVADMNGAIVCSQTLTDPHVSISLHDLPSGMYLLSISNPNGDKTITAKIIKH